MRKKVFLSLVYLRLKKSSDARSIPKHSPFWYTYVIITLNYVPFPRIASALVCAQVRGREWCAFGALAPRPLVSLPSRVFASRSRSAQAPAALAPTTTTQPPRRQPVIHRASALKTQQHISVFCPRDVIAHRKCQK